MKTLILLFALFVFGTFGIVCYENKLDSINDKKVSTTTVMKTLQTMGNFHLWSKYIDSFNLYDPVWTCSTCAVIRAPKGRIQLCYPHNFEDCKAEDRKYFSCCDKDECNKLDLDELYCYHGWAGNEPPVSGIKYKDFTDKLGPIKSNTTLPMPENDVFASPCDQCVKIEFSYPEQKNLALCANKMTPDFCHLGLEKCNNNDCKAKCCTKSGCNNPDEYRHLWCHHDDPYMMSIFQARFVRADQSIRLMETDAPELANDSDIIEVIASGGRVMSSNPCKACATLSKAGKTVAFCMTHVIIEKGFCQKEGFMCCEEDFCNYKTKEGTGVNDDGHDGGAGGHDGHGGTGGHDGGTGGHDDGGKDGKSKLDKENNGGNQLNINLVFVLLSFTASFPSLFSISIFPY